MATENRKKQNVEDALTSIDALLETAHEIESGQKAEKADKPGKPGKAENSVKPAKPVNRGKSRKPARISGPKRTKPVTRKRKTTVLAKPPAKHAAKQEKQSPASRNKPAPGRTVEKKTGTASKTPKSVSAGVKKVRKKTDTEVKKPDTPVQAPENDRPDTAQPETRLTFTVAEDDITQVLKNLPVLEDILTSNDIAVLRAGGRLERKPRKKPQVKLTLTDKIMKQVIDILSAHDLTATELEHLHGELEKLLAEQGIADTD